MTPCFIALGSNLQDPVSQLRRGMEAIARLPDSTLSGCSSIYRSKPIGPGDQPEYLNAVARLETALEPADLLTRLQAQETLQGRTRAVRWGPRTLDLDILLYGGLQIRSARLTIPHPAMAERNFVLYPLAELCGHNFVLPDGTELGTLLRDCPRGDLRRTALRFQGQETG